MRPHPSSQRGIASGAPRKSLFHETCPSVAPKLNDLIQCNNLHSAFFISRGKSKHCHTLATYKCQILAPQLPSLSAVMCNANTFMNLEIIVGLTPVWHIANSWQEQVLKYANIGCELNVKRNVFSYSVVFPLSQFSKSESVNLRTIHKRNTVWHLQNCATFTCSIYQFMNYKPVQRNNNTFTNTSNQIDI